MMHGLRLIGVTTSGEVRLFAPEDAYLSYYNSPYIGHKMGTSIDIYPSQDEWGGPIYSPCDGRVIRIRQLKMGRPKEFPTAEDDYAIGIRTDEAAELLVRVLHCRPAVREGQEVHAGEEIGSLIRSRFFNFWTGPHYHVDVLGESDFVRSTRSLRISLPIDEWTLRHPSTTEAPEVEIVRVCREYAIARTDEIPFVTAHGLTAHAALDQTLGPIGAVDAGFPHYRHGGIHTGHHNYAGSHPIIWGTPLGTVSEVSEYALTFLTQSPLYPFFGQTPLRGLSLFLYPARYLIRGTPPIVLIPVEYDGFRGLSEGDVCCIMFQPYF